MSVSYEQGAPVVDIVGKVWGSTETVREEERGVDGLQVGRGRDDEHARVRCRCGRRFFGLFNKKTILETPFTIYQKCPPPEPARG